MRQTKIRGTFVFRRGFKCRKEDMNQLYFDWIMNDGKPYKMGDSDVDRIIAFLKRWKKRSTPLYESGVRIRANAHSIIRETDNIT